jgi:hypothetical protein
MQYTPTPTPWAELDALAALQEPDNNIQTCWVWIQGANIGGTLTPASAKLIGACSRALSQAQAAS